MDPLLSLRQQRPIVWFSALSIAILMTGCVDDASDPTGDDPALEICNDNIDNDGDGAVDCNDADCANNRACLEPDPNPDPNPAPPNPDPDPVPNPDPNPDPMPMDEVCDDGADNDGDGDADCDDSDCEGSAVCDILLCQGVCQNLLTECEEFAELCPEEALPVLLERCLGGCQDEGTRGTILAASQLECAQVVPLALGNLDPEGVCTPGEVEICNDGEDNDGDEAVDCDDDDCAGDPNCDEPGGEICDDGVDNDGDEFVDCRDFDCEGHPNCPPEICDDGEDNDGDGFIDCEDFNCDDDPACLGMGGNCEEVTDVAIGTTNGVNEESPSEFSGTCSEDPEFATPGPEVVHALLVETAGTICVDTLGTEDQDEGFDTVMYIRTDCDNAASEIACNDDGEGEEFSLDSAIEFEAEADTTYFIFVDGYDGDFDFGNYVLNIQSGACGF